MKDNRPVNLDLTTVSFPITAIVSIMHRICGVISWIGLGFYLVVLCFALGSFEDFSAVKDAIASNFLVQFIVWGVLTAFAVYCLATAKHIIQDFGFCEDFAGGKMISWVVIALGALLSVLAGVTIWA